MRKIKELLINLGRAWDTVCNLSFRFHSRNGRFTQAPINTRRNAPSHFRPPRRCSRILIGRENYKEVPGRDVRPNNFCSRRLRCREHRRDMLLTYRNEFRQASERTSRIDFIRCYSSIRLIDGNAAKRATLRLLARQGLMAYLAGVLDSLATIRHVPPSAFSHSTLCCPPLLFAPRHCLPHRIGEFAILIKQVHS